MADQVPITTLCRFFEVSRSGFYAHRKKALRASRLRLARLRNKVEESFERSRQTYGSPRICADLREKGEPCGKNYIARIMREKGLRARPGRRFRPTTTQSDEALPVSPNHLSKLPKPTRQNQVWVSDITYLPTHEGWHYLAVVMDLFSRRIVGWSLRPTLHTEVIQNALERAIALRGTPPGLVHHSDRGCQYASRQYRESLTTAGFISSMSRKGNCYDNAAMESFFATLKKEEFKKIPAITRRHAELKVFDYIETFYNPRRIHTSLGNTSPVKFENHQFQTQPTL
jgi:transposase InsO family protein